MKKPKPLTERQKRFLWELKGQLNQWEVEIENAKLIYAKEMRIIHDEVAYYLLRNAWIAITDNLVLLMAESIEVVRDALIISAGKPYESHPEIFKDMLETRHKLLAHFAECYEPRKVLSNALYEKYGNPFIFKMLFQCLQELRKSLDQIGEDIFAAFPNLSRPHNVVPRLTEQMLDQIITGPKVA